MKKIFVGILLVAMFGNIVWAAPTPEEKKALFEGCTAGNLGDISNLQFRKAMSDVGLQVINFQDFCVERASSVQGTIKLSAKIGSIIDLDWEKLNDFTKDAYPKDAWTKLQQSRTGLTCLADNLSNLKNLEDINNLRDVGYFVGAYMSVITWISISGPGDKGAIPARMRDFADDTMLIDNIIADCDKFKNKRMERLGIAH